MLCVDFAYFKYNYAKLFGSFGFDLICWVLFSQNQPTRSKIPNNHQRKKEDN